MRKTIVWSYSSKTMYLSESDGFVSGKVSVSLQPKDIERLENLAWERRVKRSILLRKAVLDFLEQNLAQESNLSKVCLK